MSDINVAQMKEFMEFRLDKVEDKVDAIPAAIEKLHDEYTDTDIAQSLAIQSIGDKVNLIWKALSVLTLAGFGVVTKYLVG